MKNKILIAVILCLAETIAFPQIKFGGGLTAGTKAGVSDELILKLNFGFNARTLFELNDKISIAGGFSYYLQNEVLYHRPYRTTYMAINSDAEYYFLNNHVFKAYALGGFNYACINFNTDHFAIAGNRLGFEIDGGIQLFKIFLEVKYDSNADQVLGFLGVYL